MIYLGYKQSQGERTSFIKHFITSKLNILLVYEDNMIIAGDDDIGKLALKEKLTAQFDMKDMGKLKYFLGIEVVYSKKRNFHLPKKICI